MSRFIQVIRIYVAVTSSKNIARLLTFYIHFHFIYFTFIFVYLLSGRLLRESTQKDVQHLTLCSDKPLYWDFNTITHFQRIAFPLQVFVLQSSFSLIALHSLHGGASCSSCLASVCCHIISRTVQIRIAARKPDKCVSTAQTFIFSMSVSIA